MRRPRTRPADARHIGRAIFVFAGGTSTQQLLDLKKELADLRTRQVEAQNQSLEALAGHLPEVEAPLFPPDVLTDQAERTLAAEYVREQLMLGASQIKLTAGGGVASPRPVQQLDCGFAGPGHPSPGVPAHQ